MSGFCFSFGAEKHATLHDRGYFRSRKAEPGLGQIEETHQAVHRCTDFIARPEMLKFFWDTDDQRHVDAAVKEEPLTARKHATVVRVENDNRIFG